MFVVMVDPSMGMLEIEEVVAVVSVDQNDTTQEVFDKSSAQIN